MFGERELLHLRVKPDVAEKAKRLAAQDERPLTVFLGRLVEEALAARPQPSQ